DLLVRAQDRRIDRAPESFFEPASFSAGSSDVILLNGHRIRKTIFQHALNRGTQVRDASRRGVIGIIREGLEEFDTDEFFAPPHRGREIAIAHRDDREVRQKYQIEPWS